MKTVILWLGMVLILSVIPMEAVLREGRVHSEKFIHAIVYAITSVLFYIELLKAREAVVRRWALWLALLFASVYGFLMEILQGFVPNRAFSYLDAEVNVLGAAAGLLLFRFVWERRQKGK
jgi:VanZ family protein